MKLPYPVREFLKCRSPRNAYFVGRDVVQHSKPMKLARHVVRTVTWFLMGTLGKDYPR